MSLGKVNYCLRTLVGKGLVRIERYRNSRNKPAYFYILTPSGFVTKAEMTRRFLAQKMDEFEALRSEIDLLQAETADQHTPEVSLSVSEGAKLEALG